MDLYKPWLTKPLLLLIICINLYLGLNGGFVARHYDTEYYKSKSNKSYCLHSIYKSLSHLDYEFQKKFSSKPLEPNLILYMHMHQKQSFALVTVTIFFSILGILACFFLTRLLTASDSLALLAAFFLATSFFWIQEMHYPTVDLPCAALSAFALYYLIRVRQNSSEIGFGQILALGILMGLSIAIKFFALVLLAPLIYLFNKPKQFLPVSLVALFIAFAFLYAKLEAFSVRVIEELYSMFKTGFWGYDNPTGYTFWFHLKNSLVDEYGLVLVVLAALGLLTAAKYVQSKPALRALYIYIVLVYILVGLTMCNATRYILPILPLIAIMSALGLQTLYDYMEQILKLPKNLVLVITAIIIFAATYNNFALAILHNKLMQQVSTRDQVEIQLKRALKPYASNIIDNSLHDLVPSLPRNIITEPVQESALSCDSPNPLDFKSHFFSAANTVVMLSSNKHDSFVYSWHCQCKQPRKAFSNFADLIMIVVSPFTTPKEQVPFSPDSILSPNPPDIYYRKQPGQYVEIFVDNNGLASIILAACRQNKIDCQKKSAQESYYLNRIQGVDYSTLGERP